MKGVVRLASSAVSIIALAAAATFTTATSAAADVYSFSFFGESRDFGNNVVTSASGSFSIDAANFAGSPSSLPQSDFTAFSFTAFINSKGSSSWSLSDVLTGAFDLVHFSYVAGVPQVSSGSGSGLATNGSGNNIYIGCCNVGYSIGGTTTQVFGEWTTSFVATPAVPESGTWAMVILGFAGIGWLARRRHNQASLQAA